MLEKGINVGGYRVDGVLGQGGMGVVYEATQLSLNRTVALKVLASHLTEDIAFRERFRREGQIQAGIDHPHIITVYEAGESDYGLFIAMRLVRGPNLKDMIVARELDAGRSLRILRPVADALTAAHEADLIHRDIKPQNILVGARDHPFLADFGLTKGAGTGKSLTKTGQFVGTLDYIAPEQIQGKRATAQSDLYAFGAVLYECLTGIIPFPKESEAAVLYAHLSDPTPSVTDHRPELPAELDRVIGKAMAKEPDERYGSAVELLDEAERAFTRRMRAALTPPAPIEAPQESGIREREANVDTRETVSPPGEAAPTRTHIPTPAGEAAAQTRTHVGTAETKAAPPVTEETKRMPAPAGERTTIATPGRARPLSPGLIAGAAAGLIAVLVAGFLIGSSGSGSSSPELPRSASVGSLDVSFPGDWDRSSEQPNIPGLKFQDPIVLTSGGGEDVRINAGQVSASGPSLLPRDFTKRLPGGKAPTPSDRVKLGELEGFRYEDLKPEGLAGPVTIYTAPTDQGVATVACEAGATAGDCDSVAGSLKLTQGKPFPLAPDDEYAKVLNDTLENLNSQVKVDKDALAKAKTQDGQAAKAAEIASEYTSAATSLKDVAVSPEAKVNHDAIVAALAGAASAYKSMSSAAADGKRAAYNSARADARRKEAALDKALAGLEQLGYTVS